MILFKTLRHTQNEESGEGWNLTFNQVLDGEVWLGVGFHINHVGSLFMK